MDTGEKPSYWLSYSDLAVGILLVFVLVMASLLLRMAHAQQAVAEQANELAENRQKLEQVVGIPRKIVAEIRHSFGDSTQVTIDPRSGALVLPAAVLFNHDSSEYKDKASRKLVRNKVARWVRILLESEYSSYVKRIEIQGHASADSARKRTPAERLKAELHNVELSQARARVVASTLLYDPQVDLSGEQRKRLRKLLIISGQGEFQPKATEEQSRRVEFRFSALDEQSLEALEEELAR